MPISHLLANIGHEASQTDRDRMRSEFKALRANLEESNRKLDLLADFLYGSY